MTRNARSQARKAERKLEKLENLNGHPNDHVHFCEICGHRFITNDERPELPRESSHMLLGKWICLGCKLSRNGTRTLQLLIVGERLAKRDCENHVPIPGVHPDHQEEYNEVLRRCKCLPCLARRVLKTSA